MQQKKLWVFTERNKDDESFLDALQNPENAVIFLTQNGEAQIVQKEETISLLKNSIVFFEPSQVKSIEQITPDFEMKVLVYQQSFLTVINIKLNKLKVFKYFIHYFKELSDFTDQEMDLLSKQIDSIKCLQDFQEKIGFDEKVLENLFSALIYTVTGIYLQNDFFEQHKMSRADEITFQFTKNVFQNFITEKSPKFYADLQHITSRHLTSMVKSVTGKTATQIIAEFVMNEAKILLNSTDKTIMQIADELNFGDSYTFSHYFKRYSGKSPALYRSSKI
ncbi:helix-turn-helix domain-containing protein [Kaistella sp. G5-32]|uniref:Helix-turn-helix domain-containing protein n=1 Tax=Kaistella gelatinilytica TaxID=2787636 RepID=A0ABS0FFB6_9FLAO|nr:helix-turn-helix domain-containing protein [Kaistella gelatinilytica]MBF8458371.1 helix-turn-helix domain-containing protein [Kaistella gelatinilytica]